MQGEMYLPYEKFCLKVESNVLKGDGSAKHPREMEVILSNPSHENWEGVLQFQYRFEKNNPRFYMPAYMYGRNRGELPANQLWQYPRLREGQVQFPFSPWWMTRSDRLSHPVSLVYDNGKVYGISGSPYFVTVNGEKKQWMPGTEGTFVQYAGFGCSLGEGYVSYTLGYENAPLFFLDSTHVEERKELADNCFTINAGESLVINLQLYEYEAENPTGIATAIEHVYNQYHQSPRKGSTPKQAVEDMATAIAKDAWRPEGKNYATQVYEDKDGKLFYNEIFSISWTGGVEAAVPILLAGLRLNSKEMREQALSCIQNVVDNSMNPASGLPYDALNKGVWDVEGWWFCHMNQRGHASYLVGQAIYYILKAWEYEKKLKDIDHADWLDFARRVIEKMEVTKNSDAEYPYIWSEETGAGLEYDSFAGTWCLACAAYYSVLTGSKELLYGMRESEVHYYDFFVKQMECYGTPLDTDKAVDSEGILAYLKAVHYLHVLTGEEIYLDHLKTALDYEYTFKFCYNSPIKVLPLSENGWSSCGGSVTSTCNPHIHPMSNNVVDEMLYYLKFRRDSYVQQRLEDTVVWGCQTYNTYDKEYDFGRKGWMSERFCHSEGLLIEKYPDGSPSSTWFALLPWGASNIIEGLVGDYWEIGKEKEMKEANHGSTEKYSDFTYGYAAI